MTDTIRNRDIHIQSHPHTNTLLTIEGNRFLELQNTYLHIQISQILCICMTVENSEARSRLRSNSNTGNQPSKSVISTIVIQEYRYISK